MQDRRIKLNPGLTW